MDSKIVKNNNGLKLNVMGDNQIIKLSSKDTNGPFSLIEQNNIPGMGIPPHIHENENEVFHVLTGNVEMTVGEESTILSARDMIFCPKGIPNLESCWRRKSKSNAEH